ncbi:MAG: VOC family protein [Planctomycetota bacterium]|jgi:catechol 2,3-dioxygenase-like lactoylglutathione lyase family enzyme
MIKFGEVNLWVSDVEKSGEFYAAVLGSEICERGEIWCKVSLGNINLTFFEAKGDGEGLKMGERPMMTADIATDEFDEMLKRIKAAGGEIADMREWDQGRHTFFRDPDGITWELVEIEK